ncbi:hypothetical protein O0L34_g19171 [Tuta absoluta]|nr:hypothetical protein O0L34_g19171 [Tuta absoluta]
MASRTVRKIKRGKGNLPAIVVTPPAFVDMKVKAPRKTEDKNVNKNLPHDNSTIADTIDARIVPPQNMMTDFNVNQLIAELSQNSRASKDEIETIQRRLLQQANEILKVNAFANSQTVPEPRIIDCTKKNSTNTPAYGRIPVIAPRNIAVTNQVGQIEISRQNLPVMSPKAAGRPDSQLDTQLVPEKLQENLDNGGMINSAQGSVGVEAVPPYRMPPAPDALPGAPAPTPQLHTHSAKFPIEREVILSSGDKNSKVPILQDARKRGRLGAVAPDTPPKALAAWTHAENQQAGTSGDNFRQYHETYGYAMHQQNPGARTLGYDTPKPPVPAKNTYPKTDTPNNSQQITVTVETGKDNTRDAPKSTKSVSKTYHTLKDMISSRFKSKENAETEKNNEEQSLNNSEERKRPEPEQVTPRETPRKVEQIYGRPMPQNRPEMQSRPETQIRPDMQTRPELQRPERPEIQARPDVQYGHAMGNNMAYPSPSPHRQLMQQQIVQQQMLLAREARSHEMLASPHRPQALGADALYQQYGPPGRRSAMYQRDMDARSMANFTSLKTPQGQFDHSHSRADLRSPQQLEREVIRQNRGFVEGRRATSHPHLLDEPQSRTEITTPQIHNRSRRNSYGNLLDETPNEASTPQRAVDERESDDGGFRARLVAQGRSSFEERIRTSGRSIESQRAQENAYRRTPDSHKEARRTPDSVMQRKEEVSTSQTEKNDESASQKSADSVYNSSGKTEPYNPQPSSSRHTPNRIEDLKALGKKGAGSGASSDYDKNGGQSSNVDSGRGSVAYSSGRRPETLHDTSADSDAIVGPSGPTRTQPQPGTSQQATSSQGAENEWADLVECELRQILEPKLAGMRLDSSGSSDSSVTPPLPPLSPSSDMHKRNSLPGRSAEYPEERRRGRDSPRWHAHKKHSSKRDHHYKKHLFGLDTTDMTSTTTRSLDLSSLLDGRTDSDASTGDARAIRRQLRGLENMYAEVLQLLGVRKPTSLAKQPAWESRLSSKRRYGSMSSLPSSSVSSRPVRDKRRSSDHRKKHDIKGINKRFQRLESHVVTLARSVAHLSSEMRTQHLVMQEMDAIRAEIAALRHMYKSQQYIRSGHQRHQDPYSFSNPDRVKRLTKFFGDEPPLMRLFLKKLGYEKYAALLEKEKVGAAELPYVGEDKLRALGVPLGPRMRILKEAGIHQELHHMRDDNHTTTTTLAIV